MIDRTNDTSISSSFTKRLLNRNVSMLSASQSTTSLPDLGNHTVSSLKQQTVDSSAEMQREHKPQKVEEKELEKQVVMKRRHSFTSYLNAKFGKQAKREDQKLTNVVKDDTHSSSSLHNLNIQQGKKGHRPRSYSEVSVNLPHVERAPPVAVTNKTPVYEYYGFVMYLASFVVFAIYLIWAYVPDEILHRLGITYYPNRYWALAIPIWLMTFVWFIFISFMTINLMNTKPFDSLHCITDEHANLMRMGDEMITDRPSDWMPELYDIPISLVNKILYQDEDALDEFSEEEDILTHRRGSYSRKHNKIKKN